MDCGVQTRREEVLLHSPKHVVTMSVEIDSRISIGEENPGKWVVRN